MVKRFFLVFVATAVFVPVVWSGQSPLFTVVNSGYTRIDSVCVQSSYADPNHFNNILIQYGNMVGGQSETFTYTGSHDSADYYRAYGYLSNSITLCLGDYILYSYTGVQGAPHIYLQVHAPGETNHCTDFPATVANDVGRNVNAFWVLNGVTVSSMILQPHSSYVYTFHCIDFTKDKMQWGFNDNLNGWVRDLSGKIVPSVPAGTLGSGLEAGGSKNPFGLVGGGSLSDGANQPFYNTPTNYPAALSSYSPFGVLSNADVRWGDVLSATNNPSNPSSPNSPQAVDAMGFQLLHNDLKDVQLGQEAIKNSIDDAADNIVRGFSTNSFGAGTGTNSPDEWGMAQSISNLTGAISNLGGNVAATWTNLDIRSNVWVENWPTNQSSDQAGISNFATEFTQQGVSNLLDSLLQTQVGISNFIGSISNYDDDSDESTNLSMVVLAPTNYDQAFERSSALSQDTDDKFTTLISSLHPPNSVEASTIPMLLTFTVLGHDYSINYDPISACQGQFASVFGVVKDFITWLLAYFYIRRVAKDSFYVVSVMNQARGVVPAATAVNIIKG